MAREIKKKKKGGEADAKRGRGDEGVMSQGVSTGNNGQRGFC